MSNSLYRIFELKQRTRVVNVPLFWRLRRVSDCVAATIAHPIIDVTHLPSRPVTEQERCANRNKSRVRAKVEHQFGIIKQRFGFCKVRYRGLDKNAHRLFVACALSNLVMAKTPLLRRKRLELRVSCA